jgi:hypothetical protein
MLPKVDQVKKFEKVGHPLLGETNERQHVGDTPTLPIKIRLRRMQEHS